MKILVTGGAGFIGSNLAMHFRHRFPDWSVVCVDNLYRRGAELNLTRFANNGIAFQHGDVRHLEDFPNEKFDWVIHCAAEPSVDAGVNGLDYLVRTNLLGVYNCLEFARHQDVAVMLFSSSRVYPVSVLNDHPWIEDETRFSWSANGASGVGPEGVCESVDCSGTKSFYGFTKYAAEQLVQEYRASFGLKTVVNRCGVVAGPWQFGKVDQGVLMLWVFAHKFQQPLRYIGFNGQGKQVRDFLHVQDLCELVESQVTHIERWDGWCGNVSGGRENSASLMELTTLCEEISGRGISIEGDQQTRDNDLRVLILNCENLFERSNWKPRRSVRRIVSDSFDWVNAHEPTLSSVLRLST